MVNELQSQEWAYLLDPCFQLVNTNGKPLTNGHIEVFYHGTRTPYYCASDWNGTLHPFKIKIDSLGSNVVLADPKFSYDVYVYNSYNVLQMSRYNVNPGVGGSGGSSTSDGEAPHWTSDPNGGASSSVTGGTTVYLTLPSSEDQPDFVDHSTETAIFLKEGLYHIDAVVSFKQDEDDLENIIKDLVVNTGLTGWDAQMTGQKNWTGPESTDDDRHFLELHTVVSVPEDQTQTLYFQISSPVDLDSAAIEKLDIVKLEASGGGVHYAAGYGIDITGQVISTSGMMPEASAANFVDVNSYQVDIQNIYETIAETSAMIPSGVATEQYVQDYTSAFITEDALNGYATEQWVVDQGYITSADIPPIPQDVVTSGELATVSGEIVNQIPSLDGYATEQWVEDKHYYPDSNPAGYITSADIPDVPADLVTSAELASTSATLESMIPSLDGYATEQFVEDYTSAYITSGDVPVYTAGDHIDITDYEISVDRVSGVLAGEGISITASGGNYYINNLGMVPDDVVTSGQLATVSGEIVNQIPSLDGYATEEYVEDYTSAFITEDALNGYATQTWVGQQGYATQSWVNHRGYATSADLATVSGRLSRVSTLSQSWFYPIETNHKSLRFNYGTGIISPSANVQRIVEVGDGSTYSSLGELVPVPPTSGLVLTSLNGNLMSWKEASGGSEVDIIPSIQTGTKIADYVIDGTSGALYSPAGTVPDDVVTSGQLATVSGNIMNEIPDTSDMATQTWVGQQGYLTSIPDEYVTQTEMESYVESETSSFITSADLPDVSDMATQTWVNQQGYISQIYTDSTITGDGTLADPFSVASAANWTQAYDAINASAASWNDAAGMNEYPISAGPGMSIEDVSGVTVFQTSGTMMDELIEFNSQDEISGYNGHPVMTVDSEKQWLTHDDTIAHVTNSAQYAFGVNVPVVAQAMGVDETVLFTSSAALDNISTSEVVTNFERLRIELQSNQSTYVKNCVECIPDANNLVYACTALIPAATYPLQLAGIQYTSSNGKDFTFANGTRMCYKANQTYGDSSTTTIANSNLKDVGFITKIVGIGRKENT